MKRSVLCFLILTSSARASVDTIGPNGINSAGLLGANGMALTGAGVPIGQVEGTRPGDPGFDTNAALIHNQVNPAQVFFRKSATNFDATANLASEISDHAEAVAGVMISSVTANPPLPTTVTGVAPAANLYAGGVGTGADIDAFTALTMQQIATLAADVRAINFSAAAPLPPGATTDAQTLLSQFVDWSANKHDVLYVIAGAEVAPGNPSPTDIFNGMVVGYSSKVGGVYSQVGPQNEFSEDAFGARTSISLVAPADSMNVTVTGTGTGTAGGTSFAAPHVTGTVALLQEFANQQIMNVGAPHWKSSPGAGLSAPAQRHEVMKAVLMNSADKIIDNNTFTIPGDAQPAPIGTFLGMERTVIDDGPNQNGVGPQNWLQSEAYGDTPFSDASFIPLDDQMGTGHLNAKRALKQFQPGEYDANAAAVPAIGWDYGHTTGAGANNKYVISQQLLGGSFISITTAWDRVVTLNDTNSNNLFDFNESFQQYTAYPPMRPTADDVINDLDLYLVPAGMTIDDAVATSLSNDSTIEHMFFRIPTTGQYEIWVNQFDADIPGGQDYGIAWWAAAVIGTSGGDYNGNQIVDAQDYNVWRGGFGGSVTAGTGADGNSNGAIDAADYVVWRNNLGSGSGTGSGVSAVPEPCAPAFMLLAGGAIACFRRRHVR